jgi:hypothetical protein
MHGKMGFYIAYLIKTTGKGVHRVHRYINFIKKAINIDNKYQLSYKYDVPMYPDEHTGAYGFFMPRLKERVFGMRNNGQKEAILDGQTTSRYTGSSAPPQPLPEEHRDGIPRSKPIWRGEK